MDTLPRFLLWILLVTWLSPGARAQSGSQSDGRDLRRYGFSRELTSPLGERETRSVPDGRVIPQPRRPRSLPSRSGETAPPSPSGSPPLVLQEVPGARKLPTGAPLIPALPTSRAPATYVGDTTCLSCHPTQGRDPEVGHLGLSRFSASLPANQRGCEGCHGPGSKHGADGGSIVNPATQDPRVATRTCLACHKMRGLADAHEWFFSRHASARLSCTTCHRIHGNDRPKLLTDHPDSLCMACHQRVARSFRQRSHHPVRKEQVRPLGSLTSGKVRCIDCHDPHRDMEEDREQVQEATCARCHPGFVGPFAFPHVTPRDGGSCLACHAPHGSPNRNLLHSRRRGVCIQCHAEMTTHNPGRTCNTAGCHVAVHGSNRDPLFRRP